MSQKPAAAADLVAQLLGGAAVPVAQAPILLATIVVILATVAQIDIDPTSISKNVLVDIPIVGDCKDALKKLLHLAAVQSKHVLKRIDELLCLVALCDQHEFVEALVIRDGIALGDML